MDDRISLRELERLLADDKTSDDALARYFTTAPQLRGASIGAPTLVVNEKTVEVPASRGLVSWSLKFLNDRAERRRLKAYHERIASGWKGLRFLAEGDSWFLFPILLKDVIDWLDKDYAIYSVAAAGDTLENMAAGADRLESLIDQHHFDGLLLSGGGNDIAGEPLAGYLLTLAAKQTAPEAFVGESFAAFLTRIEALYEKLFGRFTQRFPNLQIFCHGYDWPFPQKEGHWLWPAMVSRQVPEPMRSAILRFMIDAYYDSLTKVASKFNGRVTIVDCRGTVGALPEWYDELHPRDIGFSRVARQFKTAIDARFSDGIDRGRSIGAIKLAWHPLEDDGRVRTKIIPLGASVSIGRHTDREIMLDDERVSRKHARLDVASDHAIIEDLGSANGTHLDGKRVGKSIWTAGQELRIGNFKLRFEAANTSDDVAALVTPAAAEPRAPVEPVAAKTSSPIAAEVAATKTDLRQFEVELTHGNLVDIDSPVYVVGLFQHIRPTASRGSAREIDALTNARLSTLLQGSAFGTDVGQISKVPFQNYGLKAQLVALAGLGSLTSFGSHCLEAVGQNLTTSVQADNLPGFATVPLGTNTGCSIADFTTHFFNGVIKGLSERKAGAALERISLCELDESRFAELCTEMRKLTQSGLFAGAGVELRVTEKSGARSGQPQVYDRDALNQTIVHATSTQPGQYEFYTLPMSGAGLPVWAQLVDAIKLDELTAVIGRQSTNFDPELGASLSALYLPTIVQDMLASRLAEPDSHLLVIHDRAASNIPWEALYFKGRCPALETGVTRKCFVHSSRPPTPPLVEESILRMLVVYPEYSGDDGLASLPGATDEGILLARLFRENHGEVTIISGENATKEHILKELKQGGYTILHYAGHAWFDQQDPRQSGLLLARNERITAEDLDRDANPPRLIFLNACESSRMRSAAPAESLSKQRNRIEASGSLAEGLMSIGVENLVGTYWAVDDAAARLFAQDFYGGLLAGKSMSTSLRAARQAVKEWSHAGNRMWANYLHFGDPTDKLRTSSPVA